MLLLPFIFCRLWWRSLKVPAYRQRWAERLGLLGTTTYAQHGVLIHAVSVGEVVAAIPLVTALRTKFPNLAVTVTTTTPTGSQRVRQSLGDKVAHVYLPYDLNWALGRLFNKIKPKCLIIMETELWPNLLYTCKQRAIPVIIANGRLSAKSFAGYSKIKFIISNMLQQLSKVAAQSNLDAERFRALGLANDKVVTTGNLKFDVQVASAQLHLGKELKASWGQRLILVAASTHVGEEEQVLAAYKIIKAKFPTALLVLVPRHPDRFNQVADLIQTYGFSYIRRSQNLQCGPEIAVLLGDTMGELNMFYATADVAFVGGSLVPVGGHNLLEPTAMGVATITGPYTSNFQEITQKLLQADALCVVSNTDALTNKVCELFADNEIRTNFGAKGVMVLEQNRGAITRLISLLVPFLDQPAQFSAQDITNH